ncbi:AAA family ATPase [Thermogutta sp.]|uniref:AAA family ATPase n=1 Tax=Thermogutta sp. TaxID=1962930 RepID=UPI00321F989A
MTRIVLTALEVVNCGPWRGRHRFEFSDRGLSVYCAPNETGKTTLLRLVAAILWGHDPPDRNWYVAEGPYEAALEYKRIPITDNRDALSEKCYGEFRVHRDFYTSRVELQTRKEETWEVVRHSRHRARGRTADAQEWTSHIQNYFAPISAEAFVRLAMLSPPFDPQSDGQGGIIQSLIAGAGENTKEQAQKILLDRHRKLTKESRAAGLSTADARNPGELDKLREERQKLETAIRQAEQHLETGLRIREEIEDLTRSISDTENERQEVKHNLDVLERVRQLRREHRAKKESLDRLTKAMEEWQSLLVQEAELRAAAERFPEFLRKAAPEARKRWYEQLQAYRDLLRDVAEKAQRLASSDPQERFTDVCHWPEDAPQKIERLQQAIDHLKDTEERLAQARWEWQRVQPVVDPRRQWPVVLGGAAIVGGVVAGVLCVLGYLLVGVVAGLLAAVAAGWGISRVYRPTCWPTEYTARRQEMEECEKEVRQARETVEELWGAVESWAGTRDLNRLHQGLGRFRTFLDAREEFRQEIHSLEEMQARLLISAVPSDILDLCGIPTQERGDAGRLLGEEQLAQGFGLLDDFAQWEQKHSSLDQQKNTLCRSMGVSTGQELEENLKKVEEDFHVLLLEVGQFRRESALAEEAWEWDASCLEREVGQLEEKLTRLDKTLEKFQAQRNDRERELARWEGQNMVNVAQARQQLASIDEQLTQLENRARAIAQASQLIEEAYQLYSSRHREAFQKGINQLMGEWTGRQDREFCVDEDFVVSFRVSQRDTNGDELLDWKKLSQGTQDQLALAIRWAVLDRLAGEVVLPLLLDDCFHMWDENRRENLRQFLQAHPERQIILVTHDARFLSWGQPVVHYT